MTRKKTWIVTDTVTRSWTVQAANRQQAVQEASQRMPDHLDPDDEFLVREEGKQRGRKVKI